MLEFYVKLMKYFRNTFALYEDAWDALPEGLETELTQIVYAIEESMESLGNYIGDLIVCMQVIIYDTLKDN